MGPSTAGPSTRTTLLDALRERLGLTGNQEGCDRGQCGACTVLVDGRRINSWLALAVAHQGAEILTIEVLAARRSAPAPARVRQARRYPAPSQALLSGATYQLRNLATTGGNLMQRTRCVYFQDVTKPCNKRIAGSGRAAREGYHRSLAVLGHSPPCVPTQPPDMAVALAAFDAVARVQWAAAAREVPLAEFYRLPGDEPQRDTVLERGERTCGSPSAE